MCDVLPRCLYCDHEFKQSINGKQKFCKPDHCRKYNRNQYDTDTKTFGYVKCLMCPRMITKKQPNHRYCTNECARRGLNARRKLQPAYINARKKKIIKRPRREGNAEWQKLKDI